MLEKKDYIEIFTDQNKKPFQPNDPANRKYMKEAGYGKTKTIGGGGDDGGPQLCPDGTLPPCDTMNGC